MLKVLIFLGLLLRLHAGVLLVEVKHEFEGKRLVMSSLRYQGREMLSVSRLSYLLSEFALQKVDGSWVELPAQFAYLDEKKRRRTFQLNEVPEGEYQAIRFSVGVPKKENHGDPAKLAAEHPLNPNVNQLHWDWAGGYIFMALEGRYRAKAKELKGYVYHLANDQNLARVSMAGRFQVKNRTALGFSFDVGKLLQDPRSLSFVADGASTHSHPGDLIASALVANMQSAFAFLGVSYPEGEVPGKVVKPLYLPEKYTPFAFKMSRRFPRPMLPMDNPLLEERVALGERLFHDSIISIDDTVSCAACHDPNLAFSDDRPLSRGFEGRFGKRHSMPLFNLAWKSSFFWDGRAKSLREQVLKPIQDPQEMAANLDHVLWRLNRNTSYKQDFDKAFGEGEVTSEKLALALENFLLTLTSYDSKFDRAMAGKAKLSEDEKRGMELFFTEYEPRSQQYGADCFHCHGGANFSDHQFHNNGLKPTEDLGRYGATKKASDRWKFSTPSLRNVGLTAPYMHDGRFASLEEVVAHYSGPMHQSETLDPNLAKHPKGGLQLSAKDQASLVSFLKILSDPKFTE